MDGNTALNSTITELTETGVEIRNWDGLRQRAEE
jgi:hypothetical protein